ncbi:Adenylate cyclase 1 [compost metagenome]
MELEKKLIEKFGIGVKFGIGLHTGPAVFGNIGSKSRMDYTAIGDTVNTAARLESNAKPGQIVMSEAVYAAVKDRVNVNSLGAIKVKGKEQSITVYELEGIK